LSDVDLFRVRVLRDDGDSKETTMKLAPRHAFPPLDTERIPWIPLGPGESFKPLHFLPNDRGRVLLLRLEPGTVVPRHRHLGEVHGFNVRGQRKLESGEIVGPGGYVYEPAGTVDSWMAVGEEPLMVHITSYGAMEYLGENGEVLRRDTASSLRDLYLRFCEQNALAPEDLGVSLESSPAT
jgi:quercetin dioxygenase-like cupin family protein